MTPEQKAVILDCAKEMQHNDEWWREFEIFHHGADRSAWQACTEDFNPLVLSRIPYLFRRRPKTIKPEMPVPVCCESSSVPQSLYVRFASQEARDTALAAIRKEMEKGE